MQSLSLFLICTQLTTPELIVKKAVRNYDDEVSESEACRLFCAVHQLAPATSHSCVSTRTACAFESLLVYLPQHNLA
jgi:hypothetical protein